METKILKTPGHVSLIGAGPGAADLITMRGVRSLGEAEVILHDALVLPEVFQYYPQAVLTVVGKRCGKCSTVQRLINRQLVDLVTKHQHVVRLRGGDPVLLGRADEEPQALEQTGIDYEVVPGITAVLAAASAIRQPLIKHGVARNVAFATQARTTDPDTSQPEGAVPEPVAQADSLVYYMGHGQAVSIATDPIARGRASSTPAWVVEVATTSGQRLVCSTLQQMANGAAAEWINAEHPSLLMIGDALAVRASVAAFEPALDAHPHSLAA